MLPPLPARPRPGREDSSFGQFLPGGEAQDLRRLIENSLPGESQLHAYSVTKCCIPTCLACSLGSHGTLGTWPFMLPGHPLFSHFGLFYLESLAGVYIGLVSSSLQLCSAPSCWSPLLSCPTWYAPGPHWRGRGASLTHTTEGQLVEDWAEVRGQGPEGCRDVLLPESSCQASS